MKRRAILLVLAALLPLPALVLASNGYQIGRSVIGAGGGQGLTGGDYSLSYTIGQPAVGRSSSAPYDLCAGFWCGMGRYEVYLPLTLRNS
jgi:hypothetical protein